MELDAMVAPELEWEREKERVINYVHPNFHSFSKFFIFSIFCYNGSEDSNYQHLPFLPSHTTHTKENRKVKTKKIIICAEGESSAVEATGEVGRRWPSEQRYGGGDSGQWPVVG